MAETFVSLSRPGAASWSFAASAASRFGPDHARAAFQRVKRRGALRDRLMTHLFEARVRAIDKLAIDASYTRCIVSERRDQFFEHMPVEHGLV